MKQFFATALGLTTVQMSALSLADLEALYYAGGGGGGSSTLSGLTQPIVNAAVGSAKGSAVVTGGTGGYKTCYIFVPTKVTLTKMRLSIATTGGNIDVGIYNAAGTTKLASSGSVAAPAVGIRDIAFSASVTLDPGIYVAAIASNTTTFSIDTSTANSLTFYNQTRLTDAGGIPPLPATVNLPDGSLASVPMVGLL